MNSPLQQMLVELGKHFGKTTRWRALCKERNATADEEKTKLAQEVLAEWSTGTVAELSSHRAQFDGVKSITLDEFLGKNNGPEQSNGREQSTSAKAPPMEEAN